jgi:two-component sensor histidine kinase
MSPAARIRTFASERDERLLAGQVTILTMIARDVSANETLNAVVELAEQLEPGAVAGVTVFDWAGNTDEPPSLMPADRVRAAHSCRSLTLRTAGGSPLGTFMVCFPEGRGRDDFGEKLMSTCAKLVGLALDRRRCRERQKLVFGELQHRIRNLFASVGALADVSSSNEIDVQTFKATFRGRVIAMAIAHSAMLAEGGAELTILLRSVLEPYDASQRIEIGGPSVRLDSDAASPFGMAFHELATNAAKYGALSTICGSLKVRWSITTRDEAQVFSLQWIESGGPKVQPPTRQGFGIRAVQRMLASTIDGTVRLNFTAEGLRSIIEAPVSRTLGANLLRPLETKNNEGKQHSVVNL